MSCFLQDGTGDLILTTQNGGKTLTVVTDKSAAAAQKLTNRFRFFKGEWFLDVTQGFPYWDFFTGKNPDPRVLKQLLTKVVLSVPPVVSIKKLDLTILPNRQATVDFAAVTDEGKVIVGGPGNSFVVQ